MTVRIGHAGVVNPVSGFSSLRLSADEVQAQCTISGLTDEQFIALSSTLSRYPTPEEDIVPVVITDTNVTHLTGHFHIGDVEVSRSVDEDAANVARVSMTLRHPVNGPMPRFDASGMWTYRDTSGFAVSTTISRLQRLAFPPGAMDFGASVLPTGGTWTTIETEDGTMPYWYKVETTFGEFEAGYSVSAEDAYNAACRIEQQLGGGTTWYPVPGLKIDNLPEGTRINNGRMRLELMASGVFGLEIWDPGLAAWSTQKTWEVSGSSSGTTTQWNVVQARHNRPDCVVISVTAEMSGLAGRGPTTAEFELRRGDNTVSVIFTGPGNDTWSVTRGEAETAIVYTDGDDYGLQASSADAQGNTFTIWMTDELSTTTLTPNAILTSPSGSAEFRFGVGIVNTTTAPDNVITSRREYYAIRMERTIGTAR